MKRLAIGASLALLSFAVQAQDPLPDWVLRMSRVKRYLRNNFERIPNYVCRETVDRYRQAPRAARAVKMDRLQFEVAEVDRREMLVPAGATAFEDRALSSLMSSGVLTKGDFSALPHNLFVADGATVRPHPITPFHPSDVDGEGWDYELSALTAPVRIETSGGRAEAGARGTFWVNRETMDLIRIDEELVDLPPESGMTASTSSVEYARMQIGPSSVLLPRQAQLTVVNLDGSEYRNELTFAGCREYTSESTVHFGDTVAPPVKKQ